SIRAWSLSIAISTVTALDATRCVESTIPKVIGANSLRRSQEWPQIGRKIDQMANIEQARKALLRTVLEGDGKASAIERRSAFNNGGLAEPLRQLVDKVALNASAVNDEDINRARRSGSSEDQIFEIVVCAAIGKATRQYDAAKAALEGAQRK